MDLHDIVFQLESQHPRYIVKSILSQLQHIPMSDQPYSSEVKVKSDLIQRQTQLMQTIQNQSKYKVAIKEGNDIMRSGQLRLNQMKSIKDQLEAEQESIKVGMYRPRTEKNQSPESRFQTLEDTFKSHRHYFSSLRRNINKPPQANLTHNRSSEAFTRDSTYQNRTTEILKNQQSEQSKKCEKPQNLTKSKLQAIIRETSQIVNGLIPDIRKMKKQDKFNDREWDQLQYDQSRDLNLNRVTWQQDQKYQEVKNQLKEMQQDAKLASRLFQVLLDEHQGKHKECQQSTLGDKRNKVSLVSDSKKDQGMLNPLEQQGVQPDIDQVKLQLEGILKKYQRMKQNQYLTSTTGLGWKLNSTKSNLLQSKSEQEYEMLVENLDWGKKISTKQELQRKFIEFERKIRQQSQLSLQQQKLQLLQFSKSQEEIIKRQNEKIYKVNVIAVDTLEQEEKDYQRQLKQTKEIHQESDKTLKDIKKQMQRGWEDIRRCHHQNYGKRGFV